MFGTLSRFALSLACTVSVTTALAQTPASDPQKPVSPAAGKPPAVKSAAPRSNPAPAPAAQNPAPTDSQGQGPVAQDNSKPIALMPMDNNWIKVCGKDPQTQRDICSTSRGFGVSADQPPNFALLVLDVEKEKQKKVRFFLPWGFLLVPGFRVTMEGNAISQKGAYNICMQNGCFGQIDVENSFIDSLKKTSQLSISVQNDQGQVLIFQMPMTNFAAAFDSKGLSPQEYENMQRAQQQQQQQQLQDELQRKAEQEKLRLQSPGSGGLVPAPK